MIVVKLLGGARKIVGRTQVSIDASQTNVSEIFEMLHSMSRNSGNLNPTNMLIVVNGVELSILGGLHAQINDGDIVRIVPVVHGG